MGEHDLSADLEFAVVLRETGELIGETGLYSIDWIAGNAESGYWLYRPADRGRGYGTEANLLLLGIRFDRLELNMIWAWVKERNPRSQAALRKQGLPRRRPLHLVRLRTRRLRERADVRPARGRGGGQHGTRVVAR